jgi:hypothetical protein
MLATHIQHDTFVGVLHRMHKFRGRGEVLGHYTLPPAINMYLEHELLCVVSGLPMGCSQNGTDFLFARGINVADINRSFAELDLDISLSPVAMAGARDLSQVGYEMSHLQPFGQADVPSRNS